MRVHNLQRVGIGAEVGDKQAQKGLADNNVPPFVSDGCGVVAEYALAMKEDGETVFRLPSSDAALTSAISGRVPTQLLSPIFTSRTRPYQAYTPCVRGNQDPLVYVTS